MFTKNIAIKTSIKLKVVMLISKQQMP